MELTRVGFQRSKDSPEKFSDDYREWLEYEEKLAKEKASPQMEAMQLEVLRRMRAVRGDPSTSGLKNELDSKLSAGRSRLQIHMHTILEFVTLLEDLNGPKRWVCTSHYDLVFWDKDYEAYGDTPEGAFGMLSVSIVPFTPPEIPKLRLTTKGELVLETPDVHMAAEEAGRILQQTNFAL